MSIALKECSTDLALHTCNIVGGDLGALSRNEERATEGLVNSLISNSTPPDFSVFRPNQH